MFPYLSYFPQCCVFVYSSLLSFQISHALPLCVLRLVDCLPVLIIVTCPVMIVDTCSSSPCVYSLCVPVVSLPVRLSFLRVVSVPAISHVNTFPRDTDPCLPYRLCFWLFPTCTSAWSSTVYLCTEPGLELHRPLPLPATCWICLLIIGLPYRVPNSESKTFWFTLLYPCLWVCYWVLYKTLIVTTTH